MRRRWTVTAFFAICVLSAMILSLAATPMYKATALLQIQPDGPNLLSFDDVQQSMALSQAYADFFAKTFKAKLTALHVVPDFSPALYEAWPQAQAELAGKIEATKISARAQLDHLCAAEGVCPTKVIVAEGAAVKLILQTAKKEGADLLVVGRRGISGHEQNLIGSVTAANWAGANVCRARKLSNENLRDQRRRPPAHRGIGRDVDRQCLPVVRRTCSMVRIWPARFVAPKGGIQ